MLLRTQECFAVKPGLNAHLDVARKMYIQTVEEIFALCAELAEQCALQPVVCGACSAAFRPYACVVS